MSEKTNKKLDREAGRMLRQVARDPRAMTGGPARWRGRQADQFLQMMRRTRNCEKDTAPVDCDRHEHTRTLGPAMLTWEPRHGPTEALPVTGRGKAQSTRILHTSFGGDDKDGLMLQNNMDV